MPFYCSDLSNEYRTGEYRVTAQFATVEECVGYPLVVESDLTDSSGIKKLLIVALPDGGHAVRLPQDGDMLSQWKSKAKRVLKYQRDYSMENTGAVTQVIGSDGNNITMDCRYTDKDNMDGLKVLMDAQGLTHAEITDFYNKKHVITRQELDVLLFGMLAHVAGILRTKWSKDELVNSCADRIDLEDIIGGDLDDKALEADSWYASR